jgi:hypothetical protein
MNDDAGGAAERLGPCLHICAPPLHRDGLLVVAAVLMSSSEKARLVPGSCNAGDETLCCERRDA